jgi:thiosulfate/3-mercaptopyruvate sulfurtransferase
MARVLIVGGGERGWTLAGEGHAVRLVADDDAMAGERGWALARTLAGEGHAVRLVVDHDAAAEMCAAAGIECWVGDPNRLATLSGALAGVTVACWLLGDATGTDERLRALHDPRLRAFLGQAIDTPMRGFLYEAAGTVPAQMLGAGAAIARELCARNAIPLAILAADPRDTGWVAHARYAVSNLLKTDRDLPEEASLPGYEKDVLVEPDWLEEHLNDDNLRVVEVDENPALYAESHIPGAIGFDWQRDLQDPVRRDFLGPADFGALLGSRGISSEHTIVLYGDRNNWFAAYTYWYLKYYGHNKVLLLNGPREKWIADGRQTSAEVPSHAPATFTAKPGDDAIRARREEVLAAIDAPTRLVDVRSPAEFAGEIISPAGYEQEGAQRGGHIPTAASIPWAQAVREDGTFKSAEELRELYGGKGVLDGAPIIAYCRIGERSAHTWFVLHELLGRADVKNYDGSWTEWGNLVGVPVATGSEG